MAEVGVAFLSAVLQVLFDKMVSREVVDFMQGRKLTEGLLRKMKIAVLSVNAVLEDAEEKQITKPIVKYWIDELKDALYDAEDIFDEIATEALRRKLDPQFQTTAEKVRNSINSFLNPFVSEVEPKIKDILDRLEDLAKQKDFTGLQEGVGGKHSERFCTTSSVEESDTFGRDGEKGIIINSLLSDDTRGNETSVIAIVGMGGIGKTTLARFVYNDKRVKKHFNLKTWSCVSEEFNVSKVKKSIMEAITSSTCDIEDSDRLQITLQENLMGKKFLLVLDDVWTENSDHKDFLSQLLQYGAQGSKVILTARNESVARAMHAISTTRLEQLRDGDCWLLFAKHAFRNGSFHEHPELEALGRTIVKKCEGLPLAIKAIGDLLWSELDVEEWKKILNSDSWDDPIGKTNILPALRLSYKYLPPDLKRCFAYCSIFPKDYIFDKDQIVLLWMAEGFLQQSKKETMKEVGNRFFLDLVSRSLFQQLRGTNSGFVMHALVNDLAKFVSGQFSFTLEGDNSHEIVKMTRYLSYFGKSLDTSEKIDDDIYKAKRLRSFLALDSKPWWRKIKMSRLRCLRVLSLSHNWNVTKLPNSISKIKHIRYLDLSFTRIKRLPNSICKLCNLQTLKLSGCKELTVLPRDMWKLTSLCHIDITGTVIKEMPMRIDRLECLQRLTHFIVSKHSGSRIGELGKLVNLRGTLSILGLQNVVSVEHALNACFKDKKYLEELVLEWNASDTNINSESQIAILYRLQPHPNLKSLTIKYYGGKTFPDWVGRHSFSKIASLHLYKCKYCCSLPQLGQLPSLQELSIVEFDGIITVGREFYGSGSSSIKPFGALKVLRFEQMLNLEKWLPFDAENEVGSFPNLKELYIGNCPKLTEGLPLHLPSLAKLEIIECPQLEASLPSAFVASLPICEIAVIHGKEHLLLKKLPTGMKKLKIERSCAEYLPEGMMDPQSRLSSLMSILGGGLLSALKSIQIKDCPMLELPMDLSYSSLERLELMNSCDSLKSFNLDLFPKLNNMSIDGCRDLESLTVPGQDEHDEILMDFNSCLQELKISHCSSLMFLPMGGLLSKLKTLGIIQCSKLELPMDSNYSSLERLELMNSCDSLRSFPLDLFPNLNNMKIDGCRNLESLTVPGQLEHDGIMDFNSCLQELETNDCSSLISLPKGCVLSTLKTLEISSCMKLELPVDLNYLSLERLMLKNSCDSLKFFPIDLFPKLSSIIISDCRSLESVTFPEQHEHDLMIVRIEVHDCPNFVSFPKGGLRAPNLRIFEVSNCESLRSLPEKMHVLLPSLEDFKIKNCTEVEWFPEGGLPSNLKKISIISCEKLIANRMGWGLQNLPSLTKLEIGGKSEDVESFPEARLLPTTLTFLSISGFPNFSCLDKNGLQQLTSLECLRIEDFPSLKYMPEEGLSASLSVLEIVRCPLLKKQLFLPNSSEWPKIAHIDSIRISFP